MRLVHSVHSSLASLNRILRGSSLLSTDVHRVAGALLRHEVWCDWGEFLTVAVTQFRVTTQLTTGDGCKIHDKNLKIGCVAIPDRVTAGVCKFAA